ncbi:MAG: septal ring lytic transglycosylase RlpA family protein [Cyanobacteria bacterium P01_D01_bin.50]
MLFHGLFWAASWIGSPFLLSESLPSSIQKDVSTTKISFNSGRLISQSDSLFLQPKHQITPLSTVFLPKLLNIDLGKGQLKSSASKSPVTSSRVKKQTPTRFCSAIKEISTTQDSVKKPRVLVSTQLIQPKSQTKEKEFVPKKILRSLLNFFKFSNSIQQIKPSNSIPVTLVRREINKYEVWVKNRLIARLPSKQQASLMQRRLTSLLKIPNLEASKLKPAFVDGTPALILGNQFILAISEEVSQKLKRSGDLLAIEWTNNLRLALKTSPLSLVEAQAQMYGLTPSIKVMSGLASWYGPYFHGRLTANGERFNQNELTVAHKSLPFNTYLQVSNVKTQKSVIVRVNDRGPYIPPRSLDLSLVAARCIGGEVAGVIPYKAVIMNKSQTEMTLRNPNFVTTNQKPSRKLGTISEL